MIEAYAIGVSLSLKGNIGSEIAAVGRQFETLNRIISSSQIAVNELAAGMRGLARVGRSAADSWKEAAVAMERASRATRQASFSGGSGGSVGSGGGGQSAAPSNRSTALTLWNGGGGPVYGPQGGGSFPRGTIGGPLAVSPGGGSFAGGAGTGGALMPGGFGGGGGMPPLSISPWALGPGNPRPGTHDFALAAAGAGAAGSAMVGGVGDALKAEMEVRTQLAALRMNTKVDDAGIKRVREMGEKITRDVPGSTLAENIHHIGDLFTVMGDLNEALDGAGKFAEAAYLIKNIPGQHKGDSSFAAAQAVEVMQRNVGPDGKINTDSFNKQMAAIQQVAFGTQGRVDGSSYLGFAKQSRVGGMVANDQYLYRDLPALLISLGGSRAGTGDSAVWNQFVTGKMTKNAFGALQGAGVLDKDAKWNHGQVVDMEKHLKDAGGFGANRVQWFRDVFFGPNGILKQNGVDQNDKLKVSQFLSKWSSRQTGLGFMSEIILGMNNIDKEGAKVGATTNNPMAVLRQFDPSQAVREFQASINGLEVALGQQALGPALEALKSMTSALNTFASFADKHPDLAAFGVKAFAGMGALALGLSALSGAFLVAPAMWRVASWLALSTGLGRFAAGSAAAGALGSIPGMLATLAGSIVQFAARVGVVHMALSAVDPDDRAGSWIDKNIPGASAVDDWFARHFGIGRTYDDQHKVAPDKRSDQSFRPPTSVTSGGTVQLNGTVNLDGKKVGDIIAKGISGGMAGPRTGATGPDLTVNPFMIPSGI